MLGRLGFLNLGPSWLWAWVARRHSSMRRGPPLSGSLPEATYLTRVLLEVQLLSKWFDGSAGVLSFRIPLNIHKCLEQILGSPPHNPKSCQVPEFSQEAEAAPMDDKEEEKEPGRQNMGILPGRACGCMLFCWWPVIISIVML